MFTYFAYGLLIQSDLSLPFLSIDDYDIGDNKPVSTDVLISLHPDSILHTDPPDGKSSQWEITRNNAELVIKDLATFHIQQGKQIVVHPASPLDEKMIQVLLINSVLAILLFQRKMLVLHASSIQIGDTAVAFMGASGAGKSLMAGALCVRGHSLITDDIASIELLNPSPCVYPGYSMVKMTPNESAMLGFADTRNKFLHERHDKYGCVVKDFFKARPCPLKYIFSLAIDEHRRIEQLSLRESFVHLLSNSAPNIWQIPSDELHFTQLEKLLEKVIVCRMTREECVQALPSHARMIEDYCQGH